MNSDGNSDENNVFSRKVANSPSDIHDVVSERETKRVIDSQTNDGHFDLENTETKETQQTKEIQETPATSIPEINTGVYKTRFWVLGLYACTTFLSICVWGTFGPIMYSAEYAFGWEDWYIPLLEMWATVISVFGTMFLSWLAYIYGLRKAMLAVTSLLAVGTGVRCISLDDTVFTYLASVCAILNGFASSTALALVAMVSAHWFTVHERATATAVGAMSVQLSGAGMYLSPLVVRSPPENSSSYGIENEPTRDEVKGDIRTLMFIHFGLAVLFFLCTLAYFPEKPPKPPSVSSSIERINYIESIKELSRNPQPILCTITFMFAVSIPMSWASVMNFSLGCLNISQDESMWIAISAYTLSPVVSFIVARIVDKLYSNLKVCIIILLFTASCFFFWFLLITEGVIENYSLAQIYIAIIFAVSMQYSAIPLLIELTVELAYPCPESAIGGLLTTTMDIVDTALFLFMMIPSSCFRWLSYALVGCTSLTLIPMLFVKEVHKRSDLDQ